MNVKARNYRWPESKSKSKVCNMYSVGQDETVNVMLECEKYDGERTEMMYVISNEISCEMNEVEGKTGREWMFLYY